MGVCRRKVDSCVQACAYPCGLYNELRLITTNMDFCSLHDSDPPGQLEIHLAWLTPESIASYLTNLVEFSKTVPLSQILEYVQQKAGENFF